MPLNFVRYKQPASPRAFPTPPLLALHYWMAPVEGEPGLWRVGFHQIRHPHARRTGRGQFKPEIGEPVAPGEASAGSRASRPPATSTASWTALSLACNPALEEDACIVRTDPYEIGWLYSVRGEPEPDSLDVHGYIELLSGTIQKMAEDHARRESATRGRGALIRSQPFPLTTSSLFRHVTTREIHHDRRLSRRRENHLRPPPCPLPVRQRPARGHHHERPGRGPRGHRAGRRRINCPTEEISGGCFCCRFNSARRAAATAHRRHSPRRHHLRASRSLHRSCGPL